MAELIIFYRGETLLRENLSNTVTIGSNMDCDIQLSDSVASHHARIEVAQNGIVLVEQEDPVYINGQRLMASQRLQDGDTFDVGAYRFQFLESSIHTTQSRTRKTLTASLSSHLLGRSKVIPTLHFLKPIQKKTRQVRLILGRKRGCDIVIHNSYVSSRHAEIFVQDGIHYIRDLHSRNGTYVNDFRITERELPGSGTIRLGRYSLTYQIDVSIVAQDTRIQGVTIPTSETNATERLIVGKSPPFRKLMQTLKKIAPTDDTVLLMGETGTGKDLFAQYLHYSHKKRKRHPLVIVNSATIPETMADSQLFGHVKGAFTGAVNNHPGFFQQAHKGSLFLDEVGELSSNSQARLLRVVEDGMIRPVGATQETSVNVRLICATNRDLDAARFKGTFREDLFERFDWIIPVPPLRERSEDIPLLAQYFLEQHSPSPLQLPHGVMMFLEAQEWRGNIRSLNRAVRRAITNAISRQATVLSVEDFELTAQAPTFEGQSVMQARETKRQMLPDLLERYKGNVSQISRELGISRLTIRRWMEADGIDIDDFRA